MASDRQCHTFGKTFHSLNYRSYRLFFIGQAFSVSGTFINNVALIWLVLRMTNSGVALGSVSAVQFLPILLGGLWAGPIADRYDRRRLLVMTQSIAGVLVFVFALLLSADKVNMGVIYIFAILLGCTNALTFPAAAALTFEMVPEEAFVNATTLNGVMTNTARMVGAGAGGVLIETVGLVPCFFVNALSYSAMVILLSRISRKDLLGRPPRPAGHQRDRRGALHYVKSVPVIRNTILMLGLVGIFAFEFQVTLPLLARFTFGGDAGAYAAMSGLMGLGAVIGGISLAGRLKATKRALICSSTAFAALLLCVSVVPNLIGALILMIPIGICRMAFVTLAHSLVQLSAEAEMRGRVMGLYYLAFTGSTPIGAPIMGWISEAFGPRTALAVGGMVTLAAVGPWLFGRQILKRDTADCTLPMTAKGGGARETSDPDDRIEVD